MWIDAKISNPVKEGKYKTLVRQDGLGSLKEVEDELFNGTNWDLYQSHSQFVVYWWANEEEYQTISDFLEKGLEEYHNALSEASKNFGGL